MEGKTIKHTLELADGYTLVKFTDGTSAFVKVLDMELIEEELVNFFASVAKVDPEKLQDEVDKVKDDIQPNLDFEKEKPADTEPDNEPGDKEGDAMTWPDMETMSKSDLRDLIKDNGLDTDRKLGIDEMRISIAKECEIDIPEGVEEPDDDYTWDNLAGMDENELDDLITEQDLVTDIDEFADDESGLRRAVAEELGIEAPAKKKKKKKKK